MFDIGFTELMLIALVGLIVIGPERMPKVARTVGHLLGRLQRYVSDVKSDINREMQLEELKKLQTQVVDQARDLEQQVNDQMNTVDAQLNQSILASAEQKVDESIEAAVPYSPPPPQSAEPDSSVSSSKPPAA